MGIAEKDVRAVIADLTRWAAGYKSRADAFRAKGEHDDASRLDGRADGLRDAVEALRALLAPESSK